MGITPYEVKDIPVSSRDGSGRNSSVFTDELINQLLNNRGKKYVVHYEDFEPKDKNLIDKRRIAIAAMANYARSKNKGLHTKVRTVEENGKKRIYLYGFFL
mgnify:CR=1 FL=1|tara:strand:- start:4213 stop:4515 length:303 start_codon:yes stop_codon:yes gene_type:complete